MSDLLADLRRRAQAAREFEVDLGADVRVRLRTPTRVQARETAHRHGLLRTAPDAVELQLLQHYLLLQAVVGWVGVRCAHVDAAAGADPLPWSADAVPLVLDAQPLWADALGSALLEALNTRVAAAEADGKN